MGVVETILQEMVDKVVNGEGLPFQSGPVKDGPTQWFNQCLYECTKCGRQDYSVKNMMAHCRGDHGDSRCLKKLTHVVYECQLCFKELSCDYVSLEAHVRLKHGARSLTEYNEVYALGEHLAAVKNLSAENAASIRSAVWDDKPRDGNIRSRVSFSKYLFS